MDGKTITKQPEGVDMLFAMYQYSYYSYWLPAQNWYNAPGDNKCDKTSTIPKNECIHALIEAMITCDLNSGIITGASQTGKCIQYLSLWTSFFPFLFKVIHLI